MTLFNLILDLSLVYWSFLLISINCCKGHKPKNPFLVFSLVKMVYGFSAQTGRAPTLRQLEHAIQRNFGGLDKVDPIKEFKKCLQNMDTEQPVCVHNKPQRPINPKRVFNPFTLRTAKTGLTNLEIFFYQKDFLENI